MLKCTTMLRIGKIRTKKEGVCLRPLVEKPNPNKII